MVEQLELILNKLATERYYSEISRGNLAVLDEICHPQIIHHTNHSRQPLCGLAEVKKLATAYHTAFPDLRYTLQHVVAEGNLVTVHWTAEGRHAGSFQGLPPTGKVARISGMSVLRFADGKLVERWVINDDLGMLQELGFSRPMLAISVLLSTLPTIIAHKVRQYIEASQKINNFIYDQFDENGWWEAKGEARLLHEMNPVRFGYFRQVLGQATGLKVLDVGCGGGLVAEEFAKSGAQVTGLDLSAQSIAVARTHATLQGLTIDYRQGSAEKIPFADASFDVVVCCDFVEHISDRLDVFLSEMARVLKPGGFLFYDTINRTLPSLVVAIWLLQDWLQIVPRQTHAWHLFVKPVELEKALRRVGLTPGESVGMLPALPLPLAAYNILRHRKVGGFRLSRQLKLLSYAGYARKEF